MKEDYIAFAFTNSEFEEEMGKVKETILNFLYREGIITSKIYEDMILNYAIIIRKPRFFSKLWCSKFKKNKDVMNYILIKQLTLLKPKESENQKDKKPNLNVVKFNNKEKDDEP